MSVFTKRKVNDLIIGEDNILEINTGSDSVKVYSTCIDTFVIKEVEDNTITLTAEDIDFLNTGQISFVDDKGITTTDYYINNELNSCSDINAANLSNLYAKIKAIDTKKTATTETDGLMSNKDKAILDKLDNFYNTCSEISSDDYPNFPMDLHGNWAGDTWYFTYFTKESEYDSDYIGPVENNGTHPGFMTVADKKRLDLLYKTAYTGIGMMYDIEAKWSHNDYFVIIIQSMDDEFVIDDLGPVEKNGTHPGFMTVADKNKLDEMHSWYLQNNQDEALKPTILTQDEYDKLDSYEDKLYFIKES